MTGFLKRLFGGTPTKPVFASPATASTEQGRSSGSPSAPAEQAAEGHAGAGVVERYFALSGAIERGRANADYRAAITAARETYPILPDLVREWKREHGRFDIATSHAVHTAPTLMAVLEDRESIRELRAALEGGELRDWMPAAQRAEEDLELVIAIMAAVQDDPGLVQSGLKTNLGIADGHRVSQLAAWLE